MTVKSLCGCDCVHGSHRCYFSSCLVTMILLLLCVCVYGLNQNECAVATLGIVECALYILTTYYDNLDTAKYSVFADIHFALFYTAILNAFQSVLLAVASTRVSRRIWIQTEMLELNHYVEIREEFELVKREMELLERNRLRKSSVESTDSSDKQPRSVVTELSSALWNRPSLGKICQSMLYQIKYPALRKKYNELLLQVRFHELRVHFLQAYKLPLRLKVSNYLMLSEQNVLLKLVHVSSVAWVLLTGAVNVLYYALGIVSYKVSDSSIVGQSLIWIFFWCMGLFVLVASLVYHKMNVIFRAIMMEKTLWDVQNVQDEERERLAEQQLALFWGGDPKLVIAAIQFMQFGYAVALSVIIIFWEEINDGGVGMEMYLVVIAVCYAVFVLVTANVVPRFTLCTSLGQLVDEKRLHATLAEFLLEDAKRKQAQRIYVSNLDALAYEPHKEEEEESSSSIKPLEPVRNLVAKSVAKAKEGTLNAVSLLTGRTTQPTTPDDSPRSTDSDIVAKDGRSLKDMERANRIRNRKKAKSEGVTAMAALGSIGERTTWRPSENSFLGEVKEENSVSALRDERRRRRHERKRSTSDGVALMAQMSQVASGLTASTIDEPDDATLMAELVKRDTDSLRSFLPERERNLLSLRQMERANKMRSRNKAKSEGVAAMAAMGRIAEVPSKARAQDETSVPPSGKGTEDEQFQERLQSLQEGRSRRRRSTRTKASSEGVAIMARRHREQLESTLNLPKAVPEEHKDDSFNPPTGRSFDHSTAGQTAGFEKQGVDSLQTIQPRGKRQSRKKANSEGVDTMGAPQRSDRFFGIVRKPLVGSDDTFLASTHQGMDNLDAITTPRPKRSRRKTLSDGAAEMSRLHEAGLEVFSVAQQRVRDRREGDTHEKWHTKGSVFELPFIQSNDEEEEEIIFEEGSPDKPLPIIGESSQVVSGTAPISPTSGDVVPTRAYEDRPVTSHVSNTVTFGGVSGDVESDASDDGHSDVDEVDPSLLYHDVTQSNSKPPIRDRLLAYFLSKRYVVVSNVFGTMVAFFLEGHRIERFLHTQGIASSKFVSFDWDNVYSFWGLMFLFSMFIFGDTLIFYLVKPWTGFRSPSERNTVIAAILDFAIVAICLTVLIVSEVERCCHPVEDSGRRIAEEDGYESDFTYYQEPAPCGCPAFGRRLYGGLGTIEPYSSLVALRIFRHWMAKRLAVAFDKQQLAESQHAGGVLSGRDMDPFAVFDSGTNNVNTSNGYGHGHGHGEPERGTAAELWKAAVSRNPDIVSKYGEFSGELLKAMLGIYVEPSASYVGSSRFDGLSDAGKNGPASDDGPPSPTRTFALGKEYSGLDVEAQEIIMAGKLGRAVKPTNTMLDNAIPEDHELQFALDPDAPDTPLSDDVVLTCPNAPLVRSMRRCDRMLLPILNKWTVVDVVLTRFEMVYFDVSDVDLPAETNTAMEATRQALLATKGGRGLRLCDVALGRRVVGHLELSEIERVTVEREMPAESNATQNSQNEEGPAETKEHLVEYWMQSNDEAVCVISHDESWHANKEDRLKVQTVNGRTLFLRFHSDLEDAQQHPSRVANEDEYEGPIFKNNAFQWAQTIGRFCGPDQLLQSLPHFGANSFNELRDYLVVHHYHHPDNDAKKGMHRKTRSMLSLNLLPHGNAPRPHPVRRLSSLGSGDGDKESKKGHRKTKSHMPFATSSNDGAHGNANSRPKPFRRLSSLGDDSGSGKPTKRPYNRSASSGEVLERKKSSTLDRHNLAGDEESGRLGDF